MVSLISYRSGYQSIPHMALVPACSSKCEGDKLLAQQCNWLRSPLLVSRKSPFEELLRSLDTRELWRHPSRMVNSIMRFSTCSLYSHSYNADIIHLL